MKDSSVRAPEKSKSALTYSNTGEIKMKKQSIVSSLWIALVFGVLFTLTACNEDGCNTVKNEKNNGIAISIGTGDAFQEELVLKNSKVEGDPTNDVDQQNGIAVSIGTGQAAQASIVIE
jgi:hypothetical protein